MFWNSVNLATLKHQLLRQFIKKITPTKLQPLLVSSYYNLRAPFYSGKKVECSCCGGRFSTFLPFGTNKRYNAQCPKCGSLERHRLLLLFLKKETPFFEDQIRLLHFAPEPFLQKKYKKMPNMTYTGTDLFSPLADVKTDIMNMVFKDEEFDVVLIAHVLDHIEDDIQGMRELYRVLSPGGWAVIQSGVDITRDKTFEDKSAKTPQDKLRVYGKDDLARQYGLDIKQRLESVGFEVSDRTYGKELGREAIARYGMFDNANIYLCKKHIGSQ